MADKSTYLADAQINALRGVAFPAIAGTWLALYTDNPTAADTGTEVSGGSYARPTVTLSASSGGTSSNSADVEFVIASGSWGIITHVGVRDAVSGGNLLYFKSITPVAIASGEQLKILAGELDLAEA